MRYSQNLWLLTSPHMNIQLNDLYHILGVKHLTLDVDRLTMNHLTS